MMDNAKLGKFIRESRQSKGLTQKQLAECLGVSLLELMEGEKSAAPEIDREEAEQIVADTISESNRMQEKKQQMWKVRILLTACVCGILYLTGVGVWYLVSQGRAQGADILTGTQSSVEAAVGRQGSAWYASPVLFYVWAGALVIACGVAAGSVLAVLVQGNYGAGCGAGSGRDRSGPRRKSDVENRTGKG